MIVRRIVTRRSIEGKSSVASDGVPPRSRAFVHTPGFVSSLVWSTELDTDDPDRDATQDVTSLVPSRGETRFVVVTFPPDSVMADETFEAEPAVAEQLRENPGLAELFEVDHPGMHTTPTTDYAIVLDGEIWLELDDGEIRHLRRTDVVVQNATRHAWRNMGSTSATMAFILIGR